MPEPQRTNLIILPRVSDRTLLQAVKRLPLKQYPVRLAAISDELARRKQERRAA